MIIASSTFNPLPEKSSAAFDLMSWIGRGNVLTITVDMALLSEWGVSRYQEGIFKNLHALGEEGSSHDCPRYAKAFPTEVRFYHGGLNGDGLAIIAVTAERELRYDPHILSIAVNNSD